ncbi:MAG TPA: GNAT family protein [Candidatus Nitrosocosmicus sp.]|nr:GNAT family protein [Candidatus Nitrosocosmicus sp.]
MLNIREVTLSGNHVILRPPKSEDLEDLKNVALDGEIWKNPYSFFPNTEEMSIYLQELLNHDEKILPFIIILKSSRQIVGTTRFLNIDTHNHRLEIGHTWIAKSVRRTVVNTEAKFLMLQHAFEELKCIAVEIRTDVLNEVSRKAIERLGAKQDGILRNHKIMRYGRIRDTVCYSIIKEEWPDIKNVLLQKMKN